MAGGTVVIVLTVLASLSSIASHGENVFLTCPISGSGHSLRADCSHRNLSAVPQDLPNNLIKLDLSYNEIVNITNASFVAYQKIQILLLLWNALNRIEGKSFELLRDLRELDMSSNSICRLPDALFHKNLLLSLLDLSHNRLTEIPNNALGSIRALRDILLGYNLITNISFAQFSSCRHLRRIDLTDNKITHLHQDSFVPLENCSIFNLILAFNNISELPKELFSYFHHLKYLDINNTNLLTFDMRAFMGNYNITHIWINSANINTIIPLRQCDQGLDFPHLTKISLRLNKLSQIQSNAFRGFKNVRSLDLQDNKLKSITNVSFCGLDSLTDLNLAGNKLSQLPRQAFACTKNLIYLRLSNNDITVLHPLILRGVSGLQVLDLYLNSINEFEGPWDLRFLKTLNMQRNKLQKLKEITFSGMPSLRRVNLSDNMITNVAEDTFTELISLESIDLSLQSFLELNCAFAPLRHLQIISLRNTPIYFPSLNQFTNASSLKTLLMSKAKLSIEDLASDHQNLSVFVGLESLTFLNLWGNNLVNLHKFPWVFQPLRKLQVINLSDNRITVLTPGIFSHLSSLRELLLYSNEIQYIYPRAFDGLGTLQILLLQVNMLSLFDKNLLTDTPNLTKLYLHTNHLTTISANTYMPETLERLDISHNPLTCDCSLAWFRNWLHSTNVNATPVNETLCSQTSFKQLVNLPLEAFHPGDFCGINAPLTCGLIFGGAIITLMGVLVYRKRWWLNYKFFLLKLFLLGYKQHEGEDLEADDYEYQLNIMCQDDDDDWVHGVLRPALEERMPHLKRVAYGDEALRVSMYYINAVHHIIENSYKTVLLLSNHCAGDAWFITKVRVALEHVNETGLDKVILVFLEDIPDERLPYLVRLFLSRDRPNLLWTEDHDGQDLFWAYFEKCMRTNSQINHVLPI
ncbi:uncharacterized protein [Diadema antillarum]|uniref:uncharacterized protein n=1 Tax=Diadema antillarum TaxID=105358 RepID=UPI003A85D2A0